MEMYLEHMVSEKDTGHVIGERQCHDYNKQLKMERWSRQCARRIEQQGDTRRRQWDIESDGES